MTTANWKTNVDGLGKAITCQYFWKLKLLTGGLHSSTSGGTEEIFNRERDTTSSKNNYSEIPLSDHPENKNAPLSRPIFKRPK